MASIAASTAEQNRQKTPRGSITQSYLVEQKSWAVRGAALRSDRALLFRFRRLRSTVAAMTWRWTSVSIVDAVALKTFPNWVRRLPKQSLTPRWLLRLLHSGKYFFGKRRSYTRIVVVEYIVRKASAWKGVELFTFACLPGIWNFLRGNADFVKRVKKNNACQKIVCEVQLGTLCM